MSQKEETNNCEAGPSVQTEAASSGDELDEPVRAPCNRSVYLITYSKADLNKVPTRERYAEIILDGFSKGVAKIVQYAVCREEHKDGTPHYHMCLKLNKQRRWKGVRNIISQRYKINVNFSDKHSNYYACYCYIKKCNNEYIESDGHPHLANPPRTAAATEQRRQSNNRGRRKSFDALDLSEIIVQKNIRSKNELLKLAQQQRKNGKRDLALYILNNTDKCVKIIETTWEMEAAESTVKRSQQTRMSIVTSFINKCSIENCKWYDLALQTLMNNNINLNEFAKAIRDTLKLGRGKGRNLMIAGPANCGKTFLLKPLTKIFKSFVNPASGSFAWVGIEDAEIIYLNDFRWNDKIIQWQDLLRLLEGDAVHFPAPKTHYSKDILLEKDTPIFCTSIAPIIRVTNGCLNQAETDMMRVRWHIFTFYYQIEVSEMVEIPPCESCFATLILM